MSWPATHRWVRGWTLAALVLAPIGASAQAENACKMAAIGTAEVASVRDGRTLMLADGRELRLAGIEVTGDSGEALRRQAVGKMLRLQRPGAQNDRQTDRYGRIVAWATVEGTPQSLQQSLLAQGEARVAARIGDKACAEALFAAERDARAAKRGHWASGADPNFAPLSSEDLTKLAAEQGHFALVEGKVLSVRESGATIYVNFGRRWTRDFTVTIPKRLRRVFAAAGVEPDKLQGRRIRVRGFIERRGGPIVDASIPGQIELID